MIKEIGKLSQHIDAAMEAGEDFAAHGAPLDVGDSSEETSDEEDFQKQRRRKTDDQRRQKKKRRYE